MTDPTIANIPRDLNGLLALRSSLLYRIAFQMGFFKDNDDESAFASATNDVKAQRLFEELQRYDAQNGGAPAPTQFATPQPALAQPMPQQAPMQTPMQAPPMNMQMRAPQGMQMPQGMPQPLQMPGMPGMPGVPGMQAAMPPVQPPPPPMALPQQAPPMPGMPGVPPMPTMGMAPQMVPMVPQAPPQVTRQPQTAADPGNAGSKSSKASRNAEQDELPVSRAQFREFVAVQKEAWEQQESWIADMLEKQEIIHHLLNVNLKLMIFIASNAQDARGKQLANMLLSDNEDAKTFLAEFPLKDEDEEEDEEEPQGK